MHQTSFLQNASSGEKKALLIIFLKLGQIINCLYCYFFYKKENQRKNFIG
jgi:hypothetical protein